MSDWQMWNDMTDTQRLVSWREACDQLAEARAEVERLKADIRDARGLMRGMIDAKDGRVARFLIERAERFIQRTADPTTAQQSEVK